MRVLVTGGTGFVGSHTVAAAVRAGHEVRLLVRRPERVAAALAPFGVAVSEAVTGDVLDAGSVRAAIEDCDAIIHAAAAYSLDPRQAGRVLATNSRATEIVLETAVASGLDPIVHVSSFVALLPARDVLRADSPLGVGAPAYPRSKAAADSIARHHQAEGAPVVITYPGAVAGAHDPYFGDTAFTLAMMLRNLMPFAVPGGWPVADVGYVANAHAAILKSGLGPRRYLLGGRYTPWRELFASLRRLTGRRLPAMPTPGVVARATGRALDALQRVSRARLPFGYQGPWIITQCRGSNDTKTHEELGIQPPLLDQTLEVTISWMVDAGHLPRRLAGDLARHPAA